MKKSFEENGGDEKNLKLNMTSHSIIVYLSSIYLYYKERV